MRMPFVVMAFVAMIVTFVVVIFMDVAFVLMACSSSLSRIGLQVAFDSVGGTQRFAFPARHGEPIELPLWPFSGCKLLVPACMPFAFKPPHWAAA